MQPDVTPPPVQDTAGIMQAINSLKTDITKEIDTRLEAQKAELEERLQPVDDISNTLAEARKNQEEALKRQQQSQQPAYQPQSWDQLRQDAANDAYERMRREQAENDSKAQREQQLSAQEEAQLEQDIDNQLAKLERDNYLPPVGNPNDYNDPGVATRRELLSAASYMGTPELDKVADTLSQMHKNNMVFDAQTQTYKDASGTVAPLPGKFAPVGNSSTNSPTTFAGPTSREIHNMNMDELTQLAQTRGYGPVPQTSYNETGF